MADLHSRKLLEVSRANDKKVVAYLRSLGKKCELASDAADMHDKYDISVLASDLSIMRIDTKYTTRPAARLFYEVEKHKNSKADWLWYFLKSNSMLSFLIKKEALKKLAGNCPTYRTRLGGDLLVDFDVSELKKGTDYWQIDMSKAFA